MTCVKCHEIPTVRYRIMSLQVFMIFNKTIYKASSDHNPKIHYICLIEYDCQNNDCIIENKVSNETIHTTQNYAKTTSQQALIFIGDHT